MSARQRAATGRDPVSSCVAILLGAALLGCQTTESDARGDAATDATARARSERGRSGGDVDAAVEGLRHVAGFLPLHVDDARGRLLLEVPASDVDVLYYTSLPHGLGSNDVGLDRGQLGEQWLVRFRRHGARVLLVVPNLEWRSSSERPIERAAARDSFAEGVLFGFDVEASDGERVLVDATDFFLRDAHGLAASLARTGQGSFRIESSRSAILTDELAGFPDNTEVESLLTLTSASPGREVRSTAAEASSFALRVRHSFVRLAPLAGVDPIAPEAEDGAAAPRPYRPRRFDPRSGFYAQSWHDLSAPLGADMVQRVLERHHLTADEPIRYYVDRAAPEPIRTALLEGARYWSPVFAAAGFPEGFQVELLPEGADPQDVRYNVIQWVHRSTRGWSYGMSVNDPRTGEILKGHVTLGALRVRQDVLLMEGLLAPFAEGAASDAGELAQAVALDRIRQLSAHEIGHTLGLMHNFAASADGRESVMDYPAPLVKLDADGNLDLSDAYRDGCGAWDELAIRYGYAEFEDEEDGLAAVLAEMRERGLSYLTDADARGANRAHPAANLWDNGPDPLEALRETIAVRARGLARFSEAALRPGRPLSDLERVLVPLYLHHRYQLEAAVRQIGGRAYEHAIVGESTRTARGVRPVEAAVQEAALELALSTLTPEFLELPDTLTALLVPPAPGHPRTRESFEPGAYEFDPLAPARASIALTFDLLYAPERLARLAEQQGGAELFGLAEYLGRIEEALAAPEGTAQTPLQFELLDARLTSMMRITTDDRVDARVRAAVWDQLVSISSSTLTAWHWARLQRFLADPDEFELGGGSARIPPGSPIGSARGSALVDRACGTPH